MQLRTLPAKQGYFWVQQGLQIFRHHPINMLMLVMVYTLFIRLILLIPIIGILTVLFITPGISVSFAYACHSILNNQPVKPSIFLQVYRNRTSKSVQRLLWLGAIYTSTVLLITLINILLFVDLQTFLPLFTEKQLLPEEATRQLYMIMLSSGLLYLPIAMLMWFAPLLLVTKNYTIPQALFFSWLACWRNRNAFIFHLGIWLVILIGVPILFEKLLAGINLIYISNLLLTFYSLGMLAIFYCSFYVSWKSCFCETDNLSTESI
jgi:hypothetical protein